MFSCPYRPGPPAFLSSPSEFRVRERKLDLDLGLFAFVFLFLFLCFLRVAFHDRCRTTSAMSTLSIRSCRNFARRSSIPTAWRITRAEPRRVGQSASLSYAVVIGSCEGVLSAVATSTRVGGGGGELTSRGVRKSRRPI